MTDVYTELSNARKQGQAEGKYPDWYTTGSYQMFKYSYEYQADGLKEQLQRISEYLAKYSVKLPDVDHPKYGEIGKRIRQYHGNTVKDAFFSIMWKNHFQLSTPALANTGTDRGCSISCSGTYVHDSVGGFYDAAKEIALLSKNAFGTSAYLGDVRSRGTSITGGGKATGSTMPRDILQDTAKRVSQGGIRRGSVATYLPIDHGDFDEWCDSLRANPEGQNIGWNYSNEVIANLGKDVELRRRHNKVLATRMNRGKGYIWKPDVVNDMQPIWYPKLHVASNLCTEITLYATLEETYTCIISSMVATLFREYKDQASVFLSVMILDAMANEFIEKQKGVLGLEKAVRYTENWKSLGLGVLGFASLLQQEMVPWTSLEANFINTEVFSHLKKESTLASQYIYDYGIRGKKMEGWGQAHSHLCVTGDTRILTKDGQVPIKDVVGKEVEVWNGERWSKVVPFETGDSDLYRITFSNGSYLDCTPDHRFLVATPKRDTKAVGGLKTIEVEAKDLRIGDCLPKFFTENSGSALELPFAYTSGLFCGDGSISNAKAGKYPRNELRLYGEKRELAKYVDWKSSTTWGGEDCVRGYLPDEILPKHKVPLEYSSLSKQQWLAGLVDADGHSSGNCVNISMKDYAFAFEVALLVQSLGGEFSVREAKRVGGYGDEDNNSYFIVSLSQFSIGKVFSLFKPKRVKLHPTKEDNKIGKTHLVEVVSVVKLEGRQMTYCFTEKEKGLGVFNGLLTKQCAIAPNLSSSVLAGQQSQGIEPWLANAFMQDTASGSMTRINPQLLAIIMKKGMDIKKVSRQLIANKGSLQGIKGFTEEEVAVYATAFELPQERLIDLASARQPEIDQGQSLNTFFSSEEDPKVIARVHQKILLDPRIKGAYYCRSESGVQASKNVACEACAS